MKGLLLVLLLAPGVLGGPITQPGVGCGSWFIAEADCASIPASSYWTYNLSFTPVNGMALEIALQGNNIKWGIYDNVACSPSSAGCGTFSSLTACSGATTCDAALQPVCKYSPYTTTAQTSYTFSVRKNNAGSGCATTLVAYLRNPTTGTGTPVCNVPLAPSGCAGSLGLGSAGPVLYAATSIVVPFLACWTLLVLV